MSALSRVPRLVRKSAGLIAASLCFAAVAYAGTARTPCPAAEPSRPTCAKRASDGLCANNGYKWGFGNAARPWSAGCAGGDLRFEVRSGDRWDRDARSQHVVERSEISSWPLLPIGHEFWIAFSMLVEPGVPSTARWLNIGQLRGTADVGDRLVSPAIAQRIDPGDRFVILVRWSREKPLVHTPPITELYAAPALKRGVYHHFVYRIVYDQAGAGAIDTWVDGRQIVKYRGDVGYPALRGPYLKFGIYRAPAPETIAVHYANLEIGNAVLRSRIARPLKISTTVTKINN